MRRLAILLLLVVVVTLAAVSAVVAAPGTVKVYLGYSNYPTPGYAGGEFDILHVSGPTLINTGQVDQYDDHYRRAGGVPDPLHAEFTSFCVQKSQALSLGVEYAWQLSTHTNGGPDHRPLTGPTAWLFHQWNHKLLGNYTYDWTQVQARKDDAQQLQLALWKLMGYSATLAPGSKGEGWYNDALNPALAWTGFDIHGVRVLQLHGVVNPGDFQDNLYETPEPGSLVLLACGALGMLPFVGRRRIT